MDASALYDEDFVLWTEQQAAAIRHLGGASNSIDVEHLAEEIEDLGRRDVREVESFLRRIFEHLLKVAANSGTDTVRHWRSEIITFQDEARAAFTNSMRQKIDIDHIWSVTLEAFLEANADEQVRSRSPLQTSDGRSPLTIDDLLSSKFNLNAVIEKVDRRLA